MRKILAAKPSITALEVDYVTDAIRYGWGEKCYDYLRRFEKVAGDYFESSHVWPTSSCHGSLHMVLMSLGVGPGDEVIVPDATWTGSVFPVSWLGAQPVFVDVLPDTWCIDPEKVEAAITKRTKAIVAVHLYGNLCEMDALLDIGERFGLPVVEDAAEALGSTYKGKKAGSIGDFGVFSLHGTKTLTAGEGGIILSNREDLVDKLSTIESQGRRAGAKLFWVDEIGLKYKMSNLQAALAVAQFERVEELVGKKRQVFSWYREALSNLVDIRLNPEREHETNSYWMPTVIFGDSHSCRLFDLIERMNKIGVAARPFFYPVSSLPMYSRQSDNLITQKLHERGLNLPSYFEMTRDDVDYVVQVLEAAL